MVLKLEKTTRVVLNALGCVLILEPLNLTGAIGCVPEGLDILLLIVVSALITVGPVLIMVLGKITRAKGGNMDSCRAKEGNMVLKLEKTSREKGENTDFCWATEDNL